MSEANRWLGAAPDNLSTGGALEVYDREAVYDSIVRLLLTAPGEYRAEPSMGNYAFAYLHREVLSLPIATVITYSCLETLAKWEDRIVVDLEADILPATLNQQTGNLRVQIDFVWADTFAADRVIVDLPRLGGTA